jgi:hypothetical protein
MSGFYNWLRQKPTSIFMLLGCKLLPDYMAQQKTLIFKSHFNQWLHYGIIIKSIVYHLVLLTPEFVSEYDSRSLHRSLSFIKLLQKCIFWQMHPKPNLFQ